MASSWKCSKIAMENRDESTIRASLFPILASYASPILCRFPSRVAIRRIHAISPHQLFEGASQEKLCDNVRAGLHSLQRWADDQRSHCLGKVFLESRNEELILK
jgi:hypothetical protein